ncbi:MAG: hypothetical protein KGJ73_00475 [Rhodospirillales bacterium]|nr:hypothetical protein [Rhodospirillales bacterium]
MTPGLAFANAMDNFRIPVGLLIALDNRPYHFALQPYQFFIRATHVFSVCMFFGLIFALDLRLLGLAREIPLRALARLVLPWVYASFAVAMLSGIALFMYDPVAVGSHDWLTPKLFFIALGFCNAAWFNFAYLPAQLATDHGLTRAGKFAAATSIALWTLAIFCACLNAEPPPRLYIGS